MQSITVSREISAPREAVRDAVLDLEPFMRAAKFDEVGVAGASIADGTATGGEITIRNSVGFLTIELVLDVVVRPDAVLAYEQREGIFENMVTDYRLEETAEATTVRATTEFALDASFVGPLLDATVIKRQRRRELDAQFDHLESACG